MDLWLNTPLLNKKEYAEIGINIRKLRKNKGWTQEELAGYVNSDYRVISRHENGYGINLEMLIRYKSAFDCDISELLPQKYRHVRLSGLSSDILVTIRALASLPTSKQNEINNIIKKIIDLYAPEPKTNCHSAFGESEESVKRP